MKKRLLILFITGIMVSCEFAKEYSFAPSTIKIQSVSLRNDSNQSISHHIRDLWVYIDDEYVGSFSVPFSFPVLQTGEKRIKLYAGIRYYGILSKPEIYTLIAPVEIVQKLMPNNTLELQPVFFYKDGISVIMNEGFESGSVFLNDLDSLTASKLVRSALHSREGNYGGYAALDVQNSIVETASTFFNLPNNKSAFLEFDFKSDTDINVGLLSFPSKTKNYFLTLRPTTEWKKVYIPLFEVLFENNEQSFQLVFRGTLADQVTTGYYAIDNVKVLSLQ
jgi:hypothetical protein